MKFVRVYQAESQAEDLADGIEFDVTDSRTPRIEDDSCDHSFEVFFRDGKTKRTLRLVRASHDPPGYTVAVADWGVAGKVHLKIVNISPRKFRVMVPGHLLLA